MWAGEALRTASTPVQGDCAQATDGGRSGTTLAVRSPRSLSRFLPKSPVSTHFRTENATLPRPPSQLGPALLGALPLNRRLARAGPSDWILGRGGGPQDSFWDLIGQRELSPIPSLACAPEGRQPRLGHAPSANRPLVGRRRDGCVARLRGLWRWGFRDGEQVRIPSPCLSVLTCQRG